VGLFDLEAVGADFKAHNRGSFLASDDEWTAPVAAEVGPDGALWVSDWYNYIVQHNPVPNGFRNGRGNAYETRLRDKVHGRIYRVVHTASKPSTPLKLEGLSADRLVSALRSDNLLWQMHAQRLIVEGRHLEAVPALRALVAERRSDDPLGLNPPAIHALWTLHGLDAIKPRDPVNGALKHPSAAVRRTAAAVLPRTAASTSLLLKSGLLSDPDAQVRLAALLAIAEMPASVDAGVAIQGFLLTPGNATDPWLRDAATSAAARHSEGFLKAAVSHAGLDVTPSHGTVISMVARHQTQGPRADRIVELVASLKGTTPSVAEPLLDGVAGSWPTGRAPSLDPQTIARLRNLPAALGERGRILLLTLASRWNHRDLFADQAGPILAGLRATVANTKLPDSARVRATESLIALDDTAESARAALEQINPGATPALWGGILKALGESKNPDTGKEIITQWKRFTPASRRSSIALILRRPEWINPLLTAMESGQVARTDLGQEHWQQLRSNADKTIDSRAQSLQASVAPVSPDREQVVRRLLPVAQRHGDANRGREVFTATCSACHTFNGQGGKVGPDLTGIGARDRGDILIEILDPNRSVEANYRMWTATTHDGESLSGRLDTETQTTIEILDVTGQKHVLQRKDLASLEASNNSIMPVGFESIPEGDLASLLDFLTMAGHP
jgi:hypothetical protein